MERQEHINSMAISCRSFIAELDDATKAECIALRENLQQLIDKPENFRQMKIAQAMRQIVTQTIKSF